MDLRVKHALIAILSLPALFLLSLPRSESKELFGATSHLETLVAWEKLLRGSLRNYVQAAEQRLAKMNSLLKEAELVQEKYGDNAEAYVANIVHAHSIIKRFIEGWQLVEGDLEAQKNESAAVENIVKSAVSRLGVDEDDAQGSIDAVIRLMDTYQLKAADIAEGILQGHKTGVTMTSENCMEYSKAAFLKGRPTYMYEWAREAYRLFFSGDTHRVGNVTFYHIQQYYTWGAYLFNDIEEAVRVCKEFLDTEPDRTDVLSSLFIYRQILANPRRELDSTQMAAFEEKKKTQDYQNTEYCQSCRNKIPLKIKEPRKLLCWFSRHHPLLVLRPLRVERVYDDPEVLVFRNLLSDQEIDRVKELARPLLSMALVFNPTTHVLETAPYRVSKSAWLPKKIDPLIELLDKRSEAASGMSERTCEMFQIVNYGLGGQYEYHVDYGKPGQPLDLDVDGNRISTLLYYLSDVEAGGATVFTKLGLYLHPSKGDAAFWHNLHRNGTGDERTTHASCPVILGSKWVGNKWYRTTFNEFRRPCSLDRNS